MKQKADRLSDQEAASLVAGIRAGSERAFLQLQEEFFFSTVWFTNSFINNRQEAESIVSETFGKIWRLRENFATIADLRAFIFVTCRNSAYNYLRYVDQLQKKEELTDNIDEVLYPASLELDNETENAIIRLQLLQKMNEQIEKLTPQRRKILQLFRSGLNTVQIAAEMGMTEGAVRIAKFKAIQKLKKNLNNPRLLLLLLGL